VKIAPARRGRLRLESAERAKEFEYYVQYGMTPMQAIVRVRRPRELLGWSDNLEPSNPASGGHGAVSGNP